MIKGWLLYDCYIEPDLRSIQKTRKDSFMPERATKLNPYVLLGRSERRIQVFFLL